MEKKYDSRKRKIYSDYNIHSTESLLDIVKKNNNYDPAVIRIIMDILEERKAIIPHEYITNEEERFRYEEKTRENERAQEKEKQEKYEKYTSFVKDLKEKTDNELSEIIVKYSSYQPEKVDAALYVSVERGLIQYDLKESLSSQIKKNLSESWNKWKKKSWENNNAFHGYVSKYSDEEIYSNIEDPGDIVIDVYHAILVTARERELISEEELQSLYQRARANVNRKEPSRFDEFNGVPGTDPSEVFRDVNAPLKEVSHENEEKKRIRSSAKNDGPVKNGLKMILAGVAIIVLGYLRRSTWHSESVIYIGIGFGALVIIFGMISLVYGLFTRSGK